MIKRLFAYIDKNGERWLLLFFYATIISVIAIDVVRRFVLSYSSVWGEEVARYAFIYLTWIGASVAVRDRSHIRIDVLVNAMPRVLKTSLLILGDMCTLFLAVVVLYLSIEPVMTSLQYGSVTPGLRISQAWFLAAVPLGFCCLILRVFQSIFRDVLNLKAGREPHEGGKLFE